MLNRILVGDTEELTRTGQKGRSIAGLRPPVFHVLRPMTSEELRTVKAGPQAWSQLGMLMTRLLTEADDSDTAVLGFVFPV